MNQRALQTKDPIAFQHVLSSFIAWAKSSDLPDLTFMIPMHDREVAQTFMTYLAHSKYIFDGKRFLINTRYRGVQHGGAEEDDRPLISDEIA